MCVISALSLNSEENRLYLRAAQCDIELHENNRDREPGIFIVSSCGAVRKRRCWRQLPWDDPR
jgi:hypothetical protein